MLNLNLGAPPVFLSKNYINSDAYNSGGMAVSSGDGFKERLYDMDPGSFWLSSGSAEGSSEVITIGLYQGSVQGTRQIDFLAILRTNIKNFKLEYSADSGANWTAVTDGDYTYNGGTPAAGLAADHLILSLANAITADTLRLTMTHTQGAVAEKQVGGIVAALVGLQPALPMSEYDRKPRENCRTVTMGDGSMDYTYVMRSPTQFEFYTAGMGFRNLSSADRTALNAIRAAGQAFLVYPEPYELPNELFLCRFVPNSYKERYASAYKGGGYNVDLSLEEIGGN